MATMFDFLRENFCRFYCIECELLIGISTDMADHQSLYEYHRANFHADDEEPS